MKSLLAGIDMDKLDDEEREDVRTILKISAQLVGRVSGQINRRGLATDETRTFNEWRSETRQALAAAVGGVMPADEQQIHDLGVVIAVLDLMSAVQEARECREKHQPRPQLRVIR